MSFTVNNCLFQNNSATSGSGGAIIISSGLLISNTTFVSNSATNEGGAIYCYGSKFINCTFSNNTANAAGGAISYAGISASDSTQSLYNCIFWNDFSGSGSNEIYTGQTFPLVIKNSIIQNGFVDSMAIMSNIYTVDPQLDLLNDNGGPVQTMALTSGSPALEKGLYVYQDNNSVFYNMDGGSSYLNLLGQPCTPAGSVTRLNSTDARGVTRPQGSGIDLGAFEK